MSSETEAVSAGAFEALKDRLRSRPRKWLVTGGAGFIGSHLVENLLLLGQQVVAIDNFSTGSRANLEDVADRVGTAWERCRFIEGDIREPTACAEACAGAELVLHQAALGSVPRSMKDPVATTSHNVGGTVAVFTAARDAGVERVVYASSSSIYGDAEQLPKQEVLVGRALSPYALSKAMNELHADLFHRVFSMSLIGLRYFNVFGARQNPKGDYAAVIPRWFQTVLRGGTVEIYGDGETSRDFCYIENVVQANLLAACVERPEATNQTYNIACGDRMTLNELFSIVKAEAGHLSSKAEKASVEFRPFRAGDVRHSLASITKARELLGYEPSRSVKAGLSLTAQWYGST